MALNAPTFDYPHHNVIKPSTYDAMFNYAKYTAETQIAEVQRKLNQYADLMQGIHKNVHTEEMNLHNLQTQLNTNSKLVLEAAKKQGITITAKGVSQSDPVMFRQIKAIAHQRTMIARQTRIVNTLSAQLEQWQMGYHLYDSFLIELTKAYNDRQLNGILDTNVFTTRLSETQASVIQAITQLDAKITTAPLRDHVEAMQDARPAGTGIDLGDTYTFLNRLQSEGLVDVDLIPTT